MSSTFSSEMQRPSGAYEWQIPAPPVEPTLALPRESIRAAPVLAKESSYFAVPARISSLCCKSTFRSNFYPFPASSPWLLSAVEYFAIALQLVVALWDPERLDSSPAQGDAVPRGGAKTCVKNSQPTGCRSGSCAWSVWS